MQAKKFDAQWPTTAKVHRIYGTMYLSFRPKDQMGTAMFGPKSMSLVRQNWYQTKMNGPGDNSKWHKLSLPGQFLLAGAVVMLAAMFLVGNWVAKRIEDAVVQNSATTAALFMESFISPLSQELAETDTLSPPARQALAEIFNGTSLGARVVSYKIWLKGGHIAYASDPDQIGKEFDPSDELASAWSGQVAATFEDLSDLEDAPEASLGLPLLEVYSPVRRLYTGEIIAVAEFYEVADQLSAEIANARRTSWLIVGGVFLASGLLLFGIVQAGGRTILAQQRALSDQLAETEKVSGQNARLRKSVVAASARAIAQTERAIRRVGFDLHDGPAQYLSLASLRLDSAMGSEDKPSDDALLVRESLDKALDELRIISRGLALPDLDTLSVEKLVKRAVVDHSRQTDLSIELLQTAPEDLCLNYAQKLCLFRFLQETLSNVSRHAKTTDAKVSVRIEDGALRLSVQDNGPGFDPEKKRQLRTDGGQGLWGLRDRAESIGGVLTVQSQPGQGTTVTLTLPLEEAAP